MKVPKIPLIGYTGLLFIIGFIFGVIIRKVIEKQDIEGLQEQIVEGWYYLDLVNIGLPLVLIFVIKKFRAFFIGWAVGGVGSTLIDAVGRVMP